MSGLIFNNLLNMMKEQHNLPWQPYTANQRNGVEIVPLYNARNEKNEGPAAALLRYKAGARVSRHVHLGYELIFVLHGVLQNDMGDHVPGTLEICPPGSTHELWSDGGCVFLVVWEQPVMTENIQEWVSKLAVEGVK
jgi:anti-sigma factor ChrR (cupin superfamily)